MQLRMWFPLWWSRLISSPYSHCSAFGTALLPSNASYDTSARISMLLPSGMRAESFEQAVMPRTAASIDLLILMFIAVSHVFTLPSIRPVRRRFCRQWRSSPLHWGDSPWNRYNRVSAYRPGRWNHWLPAGLCILPHNGQQLRLLIFLSLRTDNLLLCKIF